MRIASLCFTAWIFAATALVGRAEAKENKPADASATTATPAESPAELLKHLRPGHPRLILTDAQIKQIKHSIETDELARKWHDQLSAEAVKSLNATPIQHKLIGPRLLDQSRRALGRITLWALMYRLDGDPRFAERAKKEMLVAAGFGDWNPSHFLDVAEMTNALALGYDWLYDTLSPEDRAIIRKAIVEKGLKEGQKIYEKQTWWAKAHHNWNQVCNGGMTVGALAVADEEPELAGRVIAWGRDSIPLAMSAFAPDGGCPEGPGYWDYATIYNAYYLAALESALGTDFGLKASPGFDRAGMFRIYAVGPINQTFNYADAHEGVGPAPQMFYFARIYHQPLYAADERMMAANRPRPFDLIWFDAQGVGPAEAKLPTDALFRGVNVAFFRSAWNDRNAVFVGFKGGDNKANHAHLDLGTFVMDAMGQRWAVDLGSDDYNLPAYFGNKRWTYYRLRTEGHNTLTIDGENQNTSAKSPIIAFNSSPNHSYAVADVTAAYKEKLSRWQRGIALLDGRRVLVQDEVEAKSGAGAGTAGEKAVEVAWNFHTAAKPEISADGSEAVLSQGEVKLRAKILSPAGAKFVTVSANPPPPQKQQPDVTNLIIGPLHLEPGRTERIAVLFSPEGNVGGNGNGSDNVGGETKLTPLQSWVAGAKGGHGEGAGHE